MSIREDRNIKCRIRDTACGVTLPSPMTSILNSHDSRGSFPGGSDLSAKAGPTTELFKRPGKRHPSGSTLNATEMNGSINVWRASAPSFLCRRTCVHACVRGPVFASSTRTTPSRGRRGSTRHARDSSPSPLIRRNNGTRSLARNNKHMGNAGRWISLMSLVDQSRRNATRLAKK